MMKLIEELNISEDEYEDLKILKNQTSEQKFQSFRRSIIEEANFKRRKGVSRRRRGQNYLENDRKTIIKISELILKQNK